MGIVPYDLLFTVGSYPEAEMKIDAESFVAQGGGPVPNLLVGLSRLGHRTALVAAVGNDLFGKEGIAQLEREKVNCEFMIIKNQRSAIAAGWVESGSGRRTMVLARDIEVRPYDLKLKRLPTPMIVHLDGRDMAATMKLARWGKRVGAMISFDIGSIRNDVSDVFPLVDHLVVADGYAFPFTGKPEAKQAIKKLATLCPGTIVVTEGTRGITGYENGRFVRQPAYRIKTVDRTGAGDAFHVGYIHSLLHRQSLSKRLLIGSAVAALKCSVAGARAGLPNRTQLRRFLNCLPKKYSMAGGSQC